MYLGENEELFYEHIRRFQGGKKLVVGDHKTHGIYMEEVDDSEFDQLDPWLQYTLVIDHLLETAALVRAADLTKDIRRYFPNEKFHVIDE